jgi:peptidoglycan/LPS O-acetylase OafA/YrhL
VVWTGWPRRILWGRIVFRPERFLDRAHSHSRGLELQKAGRLATFYIRRWFRTLPLFWLFLIINVLLELFVYGRHLSLPDILAHGFFLRNFAALKMQFFGESWSLAVEEWFYLLFPAALWLGLKFSKRFDAVFLSSALLFFLFSTIARALSAPQPWARWTDWQRMIVIYRFDALMIGVFAAWLSLHFKNKWRVGAPICAVVGTILVFGMYATLWKFSAHGLQFSDDNYFARTFRFTFVSLGFALLLPIASTWKLARETIFSTTIRRLALWSYALYLVHGPINRIVDDSLFKNWKTSAPEAFAAFALELIASITISALLYRFFESRTTHLRDKIAPRVAELLGEPKSHLH